MSISRITQLFENIFNPKNNSADISLQDQTTAPLDLYFTQAIGETTLTADAVVNERTISVASVANISAGDFLILTEITGDAGTEQFMQTEVISVASLVVTIDSPLNYAYTSGQTVLSRTRDLDVNGAITPQSFSVRGDDDPGLVSEVDITRIIIECQTATAVDLAKFGDLAALTNGLVLRKVDGTQFNIFNAKTNGELANIAYDWSPFAATNPIQGVDGFIWRYTLAGQHKHGVVVRLGAGESLEFVIQDDLTGIDLFRCIASGHVVD